MTEPSPPPPEGDLLVGLKAIAAHLGIPIRKAKTLREAHGLPTFNLGKSICASRTKLAEFIRTLAERVADEMDAVEEGPKPPEPTLEERLRQRHRRRRADWP